MDVRGGTNSGMLARQMPRDNFYFAFADFVKSCDKNLPSYNGHRYTELINTLIIKFANAENDFSHDEMHDPCSHSFQTNYDVKSSSLREYAYLIIAIEYFKKTCGESSTLFEEFQRQNRQDIVVKTIIQAFDPEEVRPGQRTFYSIGPFLPLRFTDLINYICPRIVILQAKKYLQNYQPSSEPVRISISSSTIFSPSNSNFKHSLTSLSSLRNSLTNSLPPSHPRTPIAKQLKDYFVYNSIPPCIKP